MKKLSPLARLLTDRKRTAHGKRYAQWQTISVAIRKARIVN